MQNKQQNGWLKMDYFREISDLYSTSSVFVFISCIIIIIIIINITIIIANIIIIVITDLNDLMFVILR